MEDSIEIGTRDLLTLVVILDEFEDFNNKVIDLLNSGDFSFAKLKKISKKEKVLGAKKLKEFYEKNKEIINVINSYSNIYYFIADNYDLVNRKLSDETTKLYEYVLNNKDKINKIVDLLIRVEKLGFSRLTFDEKADFTSNLYKLNTYPMYDEEINYTENMYVIPSYDGETIKYKTKSSNYEIKLTRGITKILRRKITFNSLVVDASNLPDEITKETTVDKIIKLRSDVQSQYDILRESVNLSVGVLELESKYHYIFNLANICDDFDLKEKLLKTLDDLREDILELDFLSKRYQSLITNNNPIISDEKIEKEKKQEFARRRKLVNNLY